MDALDLLQGESPVMLDLITSVRRLIQRVGAGGSLPSLLILGETGTGKTRLAQALHRIGPRQRGPYVDCRLESMPESLAESELFGYERGAFTGATSSRPGLFQSAHGGTLFLDEIGVASPSLQAKLLKAVEEHVVRRVGSTRSEPFDAWIVSATNEDLEAAIRDRRFREDLYHRLAVLTIRLPPLRERGADTLLLAQHFLNRTAADYGLGQIAFTRDAEARILAYPWPGNVRELANTIERAALLTETPIIDVDTLDLRPVPASAAPTRAPGAAGTHDAGAAPAPSSAPLEDTLRARVQDALDRHAGNISRAARELGIARNTLRARIERFGLRVGPGAGARPSRAPRPGLPASPGGDGESIARDASGAPAEADRAGIAPWPSPDPRAMPGPDGAAADPVLGARSDRDASRATAEGADDGEPGAPAHAPATAAPETSRPAAHSVEHAPTPEDVGAERAAAPPADHVHPRLFAWERQLIAFLSVAIEPPVGVISAQLAPTLGEIIDKIAPFGGHVRDLRPHGLTALFGIEPLDDFPRRAANAALAALKMVERAAVGPLEQLTGRAALHVEECLIARTRGAVGIEPEHEGQARTVLDKLVAIAPAGAAVVSREAATFIERRFELVALDPDDRALRLTRHERSGLEVGGRRASRFVGRGPELATLGKLLREAESGRGQVLGLVGGPGLGKSRLVGEFVASLAPGRMTTLVGRSVSHASASPYHPLIEILRQIFGLGEVDDGATVSDNVRAIVASLEVSDESIAPALIHLLGGTEGADALAGWSPEAVRQRTIDAIRRVALAVSRRRPLLIVVEDLQWIDRTSEETLASLANGLAMSPAVLVTTYRPGYRPPWLGRSNATQLALGPLTGDESLALVRSLLEGEPLAAPLSERIVERAAGVPFFLEELTRALADDPSLASAAIPDTIQATLAARLGHLAAADRALLQTAAVIGKDVVGTVLAAVAGVIDAPLRESVGRLEQAEFLFEDRAGPRAAFTFKHALTQEVAYRSLPDDQRRLLHGRVAEALQTVTPEVAAQQPELVAHHAMQGGLAAVAIGHWHRAARLAIRRSANAEAVLHLTKAVGLLGSLAPADRPRTELALRLTLGTALVAHRGFGAPELDESLERLRDLTEQLRDAPEVPIARFALWRFSTARADFAAAEQLAGRMLEAASPGPAQVPGRVAAGVTAFYRGRYAEARDHFEHVLRLHEPGVIQNEIAVYGNDLRVAAGSFLGWTHAIVGHVDRAVAVADEAIRTAREGEHLLTLAVALNWAGLVRAERHEPGPARRLGEELLALSREQRFAFFGALGLGLIGWARFAEGDRDGGADVLRQAFDEYTATGQRVGLRLRAHYAEALVGVGAIGDALARLDEFLAHSRERGEAGFASELWRIKGEALWQRAPRDPEARACLERAVAVARDQGATMLALRAATSLAARERESDGFSTALGTLRELHGSLVEGLDLHHSRAAQALLGS